VVAWPHGYDIFRCFKVPCEKESSWARVLADSGNSAAFAYISTKCFETEKIKCSGPNVAWQNTIPLLETAVVLRPKRSAMPTTDLQHNATHYFETLGKLLFVTVQKPDTRDTAKLITTSSFSQQIQQRLVQRKRQAWIREKMAVKDRGEPVAVQCSLFT